MSTCDICWALGSASQSIRVCSHVEGGWKQVEADREGFREGSSKSNNWELDSSVTGADRGDAEKEPWAGRVERTDERRKDGRVLGHGPWALSSVILDHILSTSPRPDHTQSARIHGECR